MYSLTTPLKYPKSTASSCDSCFRRRENGPAMECLLKRPTDIWRIFFGRARKNEMNRSVCVRQTSHDSRKHQFLLVRTNIIKMRYGNGWFNGGQHSQTVETDILTTISFAWLTQSVFFFVKCQGKISSSSVA
jgi:hypothetical protein